MSLEFLASVLTPHDFGGLFQVATWELVLKGLAIGVLCSAPMGPVGILIVNRTMNKGRLYGMATGLGAAVSDLIYALITGLGVSFVMNFVSDERYLFWLKLGGGLMLLGFGLHLFFSNPLAGFRPKKKGKRGTVAHNAVTGFLITLSNPLIIILLTAFYSLFTFVVPNHLLEMTMGYLSIFAGAILWWLGLTYAIKKMRNRITPRGMLYFNRSVGTFVIVLALGYAVMTLLHLSFLPE